MTRTDFRLGTYDGADPCVGYAFDYAPGLVLHRTAGDADMSWTITHLGAGAAIIQCIPSLASAIGALRDIAPLCDWTLSALEIKRHPNRRGIVGGVNRAITSSHADFMRRSNTVTKDALRGVA